MLRGLADLVAPAILEHPNTITTTTARMIMPVVNGTLFDQ